MGSARSSAVFPTAITTPDCAHASVHDVFMAFFVCVVDWRACVLLVTVDTSRTVAGRLRITSDVWTIFL